MRIIIILFFTFFQVVNAQQTEESKLISSGKWYIDYFEVAGQKMASSADSKESNWALYYESGDYEAMEEGQDHFGNWQYDSTTKIITIDDMDGQTEQKVVSVTDKILIISVDDDGMELIIGMKKE